MVCDENRYHTTKEIWKISKMIKWLYQLQLAKHSDKITRLHLFIRKTLLYNIKRSITFVKWMLNDCLSTYDNKSQCSLSKDYLADKRWGPELRNCIRKFFNVSLCATWNDWNASPCIGGPVADNIWVATLNPRDSKIKVFCIFSF